MIIDKRVAGNDVLGLWYMKPDATWESVIRDVTIGSMKFELLAASARNTVNALFFTKILPLNVEKCYSLLYA